jgi:protein gp37
MSWGEAEDAAERMIAEDRAAPGGAWWEQADLEPKEQTRGEIDPKPRATSPKPRATSNPAEKKPGEPGATTQPANGTGKDVKGWLRNEYQLGNDHIAELRKVMANTTADVRRDIAANAESEIFRNLSDFYAVFADWVDASDEEADKLIPKGRVITYRRVGPPHQRRPKMDIRKRNWWWDWSWSPVAGCPGPKSRGCKNCWAPKWLTQHKWKTETVHSGVIKLAKDGRPQWTGNLTALRDGDKVWTWPLTWPGVINPALGFGAPSLIFCVLMGDLFGTGRRTADIDRVCATIAASRHIGILCSRYTQEMAAYFEALGPATVLRWQPKLWLAFSAEDQTWFDKRWKDVGPLAAAGWFTFAAISPLLGPITLPQDFLRYGRWITCNGECEKITPAECRPMKADWARALRDQCTAAGIPFFMRAMHSGAPLPPDLHIRQFPKLLL